MLVVGEIYDMYFRYKEKPGGKKRPGLIIAVNDGEAIAVACKVTGSEPTTFFPNRIHIEHWQQAGLDKESWVEIDTQRQISVRLPRPEDKYGDLHTDDLRKVFEELAKLYQS